MQRPPLVMMNSLAPAAGPQDPDGAARRRAQRDLREALVLVVDTETTGVDVRSDRVVELGAAYFQAGLCGEVRRMRINPQTPIPAAASAIHGIYDKDVCDKPTFSQVAERFLAHVDGSARQGEAPLLVGYNVMGFDVPLLNAELSRAGLPRSLDAAVALDLMIFVRWHHRALRSRSLESICSHYQIPHSRAHSALSDAIATGLLMKRLLADGLLPPDLDLALREQRRLQAELEAERHSWSYWLYRDRQDRRLRLGAGRHCGRLLDDIEHDYLLHLLEIPDLPAPVRSIFSERTEQRAVA